MMNKSEKINTTDTKTYHILYETTNLINNKKYAGVHITSKLNDGYLGSGKLLKRAIKKYGKNAFERKVIALYDTPENLYKAETIYVDEEYINRDDTYNIAIGGRGCFSDALIVKDKNNTMFRVSTSNPDYLSGKLKSIHHGMITVKNNDGDFLYVSINDSRYISGELKYINSGMVVVKDKDNNSMQVAIDDPRYLSGELVGINTCKVAVKDKEGNKFQVDKDDPRYLSGELKSVHSGVPFSENRKKSMHLLNASNYKLYDNDDNLIIEESGQRHLRKKCKEIDPNIPICAILNSMRHSEDGKYKCSKWAKYRKYNDWYCIMKKLLNDE